MGFCTYSNVIQSPGDNERELEQYCSFCHGFPPSIGLALLCLVGIRHYFGVSGKAAIEKVWESLLQSASSTSPHLLLPSSLLNDGSHCTHYPLLTYFKAGRGGLQHSAHENNWFIGMNTASSLERIIRQSTQKVLPLQTLSYSMLQLTRATYHSDKCVNEGKLNCMSIHTKH